MWWPNAQGSLHTVLSEVPGEAETRAQTSDDGLRELQERLYLPNDLSELPEEVLRWVSGQIKDTIGCRQPRDDEGA